MSPSPNFVEILRYIYPSIFLCNHLSHITDTFCYFYGVLTQSNAAKSISNNVDVVQGATHESILFSLIYNFNCIINSVLRILKVELIKFKFWVHVYALER